MTKVKDIIDNVLAYQALQIFIVLAIILGVFSFVNVPDKYPKLIVKKGVIIGVYPDADEVLIEEKLTSKVKALVYSFDMVDTFRTYSVSNEETMIMHVELKKDIVDNEEFWNEMEERLKDLQESLCLEASIENQ
ncbi:MAG: hypothetical protein HC831_17035 [Chloroflexia bacterium]|nr:hypothetical protein [Chloroflexia bacterium]